MTIDLTGDLSLIDAVEPLTFVHVAPEGDTSYEIAAGLRRSPTQAEVSLLPPGVTLSAEDIVWHLPADAIAGVLPTGGDRVVASDSTWIVAAAQRQSLGSRWRLYCRKAR
jgi:hypothetical protein